MKFNLKKAKLIYELRYESPVDKECYTSEFVYRTNSGRYYIHFEGGKFSEYAVKTGFNKYKGRNGEYEIDIFELSIWKNNALNNSREKPERYMFVDWETEEDKALTEEFEKNSYEMMLIENLTEAELPF